MNNNYNRSTESPYPTDPNFQSWYDNAKINLPENGQSGWNGSYPLQSTYLPPCLDCYTPPVGLFPTFDQPLPTLQNTFVPYEIPFVAPVHTTNKCVIPGSSMNLEDMTDYELSQLIDPSLARKFAILDIPLSSVETSFAQLVSDQGRYTGPRDAASLAKVLCAFARNTVDSSIRDYFSQTQQQYLVTICIDSWSASFSSAKYHSIMLKIGDKQLLYSIVSPSKKESLIINEINDLIIYIKSYNATTKFAFIASDERLLSYLDNYEEYLVLADPISAINDVIKEIITMVALENHLDKQKVPSYGGKIDTALGKKQKLNADARAYKNWMTMLFHFGRCHHVKGSIDAIHSCKSLNKYLQTLDTIICNPYEDPVNSSKLVTINDSESSDLPEIIINSPVDFSCECKAPPPRFDDVVIAVEILSEIITTYKHNSHDYMTLIYSVTSESSKWKGIEDLFTIWKDRFNSSLNHNKIVELIVYTKLNSEVINTPDLASIITKSANKIAPFTNVSINESEITDLLRVMHASNTSNLTENDGNVASLNQNSTYLKLQRLSATFDSILSAEASTQQAFSDFKWNSLTSAKRLSTNLGHYYFLIICN